MLALSLLAVTLLSASSAQAAAHRVGQSPAAVRAYWTAERMRDAVPADRVRDHGPATPAAKPGGGGGGSGSPLFTTFQPPLAELTAAPVSTNGRVFFSDGRSNYSCSGTAVQSSNQSVVLTAGHCVNQGPGSYYTNWTFAPAYNDGSRPFGTWPAVALDTTAAWRTRGDFGRDVGAAVVAPNSSNTRLTQSVGARSVTFNYTRNQDYLAHGYPAEATFNGQRLWISDTRWSRDDTSATPATMGIPTDLNGGSSGGALGRRQRLQERVRPRGLGQQLHVSRAEERHVRPLPPEPHVERRRRFGPAGPGGRRQSGLAVVPPGTPPSDHVPVRRMVASRAC